MKRVFLTGASSGIGKAITEALLFQGFEVWGTSRKKERLPQQEHFHPIELDLNDVSSIQNGIQQALEEAKGFDVLINNAGSGRFGSVEKMEIEEVEKEFQTLVFGPLKVIQMMLPSMKKRERGMIINVTSLAAEFPIPFMGAYSAGKAALSALTWNLQMELLNSSVVVIDLQPGDINTEFHPAMQRVHAMGEEEYANEMEQAYGVIDHNMKNAPSPKYVADQVIKIIRRTRNKSRYRSGDFFQATLAPFLIRFVPHHWVCKGVNWYYGLKK